MRDADDNLELRHKLQHSRFQMTDDGLLTEPKADTFTVGTRFRMRRFCAPVYQAHRRSSSHDFASPIDDRPWSHTLLVRNFPVIWIFSSWQGSRPWFDVIGTAGSGRGGVSARRTVKCRSCGRAAVF